MAIRHLPYTIWCCWSVPVRSWFLIYLFRHFRYRCRWLYAGSDSCLAGPAVIAYEIHTFCENFDKVYSWGECSGRNRGNVLMNELNKECREQRGSVRQSWTESLIAPWTICSSGSVFGEKVYKVTLNGDVCPVLKQGRNSGAVFFCLSQERIDGSLLSDRRLFKLHIAYFQAYKHRSETPLRIFKKADVSSMQLCLKLSNQLSLESTRSSESWTRSYGSIELLSGKGNPWKTTHSEEISGMAFLKISCWDACKWPKSSSPTVPRK